MLHRIDVINIDKEKGYDFAVCNVYTDENAANTCQAPVSTYQIELSGNTDNTIKSLGFEMTPRSWAKEV
jgi:hypothetical protein